MAGAYWSNVGGMTDEEYSYLLSQDIETQQAQAGATSIIGGAVSGAAAGAIAGPIGALIGAIAGGIAGTVNAFVQGEAIAAAALEEHRDQQEIEEMFREARDLRGHFDREIAAFLTPLQQQFQNRMQQFGAQASQAGLTGAQAFGAQMNAERMYGETVGAHLSEVYTAASASTAQEGARRLQEVELKAGIKLNTRRADLEEKIATAEVTGALMSGVTGAIGAVAGGFKGESDEIPGYAQDIMKELQGLKTSQQALTSSGADDYFKGEETFSVPTVREADTPYLESRPERQPWSLE